MILVNDSICVSSRGETETIAPYRLGKNVLAAFCRILFQKLGFLSRPFINPKLRDLKGEPILVFDHVATPFLLRAIAKRNPGSRLIFWYWQPVQDSLDPKRIPERYERWTYSQSDAKRYGFQWNSQFIGNEEALEKEAAKHPSPMYDFCFVGKSKKRDDELLGLAEQLSKLGYSTNIRINPKHSRNLLGKRKKNGRVPYPEYLSMQHSAKCIIDICNYPDAGLSLRPLEASFLGRCLLTNCLEIKQSPLCQEKNVCVLDEPLTKERLDALLSYEPKALTNEIREYYSAASWIRRFG